MRLLPSVLAIALLAPYHNSSAQSLSTEKYGDPKGFFEITPPEGWRVQEYPGDPRGKVAFFGPNKVELRILIGTPDFDGIDQLIEYGKSVERKIGVNTNIRRINFNGRPSIRRIFKFRGIKLHYVDFLLGRVSHNLAYSAPSKYYEQYARVALASMATYDPILVDVSDAEAKVQFLAKVRRLWKLQEHDFALNLLNDALRGEPGDSEYLDLRTAIIESR